MSEAGEVNRAAPRVLQIMLSTQPGGAETFFEKLTLGFAAAGLTQCVVTEPDAERRALFAGQPGLEHVEIRFGGWREWAAGRQLEDCFVRFRPEVGLTWMNRASRRAPAGFCPLVGRLGGYYRLKHYRSCAHLVGITPDLVDHIAAGGWSREHISMIPNFGETPTLDRAGDGDDLRQQLAIPAGHTVLLALGRLHEVKAHDVLLRAMSQVPRTQLLLAGEGPLRRRLESLAGELGLAGRVHFLGWRRDIARLFEASDISVFPSRYEPNGTVVMESWAHQKPLIASRSKGPQWLVDDGQNGLLFDVDAVDQLAEKIRLLQSDGALRRRLIEGGQQKWATSFSRDAVVGQYVRLFQRLTRKECPES